MPSIFVRPRDTRHRPHKHRRKTNFSLKNIQWKLIFRIIAIIIGVVWLGVVVYQLVMRSSAYRMDRIIVVTSGSNPYTVDYTKTLQKSLQWKYYLITKYDNSLKQLISQYPPISQLSLRKLQVGQYELAVTYMPITALLSYDQLVYGIASWALYPVDSETTWYVLEISKYFTGMTMSGMFYQVSAPKLVQQYQTIVKGLQDQDIQRLTYHVGEHVVQVNTTTQELYIDVAGNVFEQLKKYRIISQNHEQFPAQRIIDLGSVEAGVVTYP